MHCAGDAAATGGLRCTGRSCLCDRGGLVAPWALYVALNGGLVNYFDRALEYARIEANATTLKTSPRFTFVPGQPLLGLARPNRPLAQVSWKPGTTDTQRQSLEHRYGLEYVREGDDARFYYVHDANAENIEALADDPNVAGTVGLGRVQRPAWREFLARISPLRLAPALHSRQNAQTWLYWLFWMLPVVVIGDARLAIVSRRRTLARRACRSRRARCNDVAGELGFSARSSLRPTGGRDCPSGASRCLADWDRLDARGECASQQMLAGRSLLPSCSSRRRGRGDCGAAGADRLHGSARRRAGCPRACHRCQSACSRALTGRCSRHRAAFPLR